MFLQNRVTFEVSGKITRYKFQPMYYNFMRLEAHEITLGKDPVPIVQEAGWASGPVWTGAENLNPPAIRSPDRPARRRSLYRLRYPAHSYFINQRYYPCARVFIQDAHILLSSFKLPAEQDTCTISSANKLKNSAAMTTKVAVFTKGKFFAGRANEILQIK